MVNQRDLLNVSNADWKTAWATRSPECSAAQ